MDYVQMRFQTSNSSISSLNHDFREKKVNYLRSNEQNQTFDFKIKNVKEEARKSLKEYKKLYLEKNKRNIRKNQHSDFLTAIITLSNSINEKLKNDEITKEELNKTFEKSAKNIHKKIIEITKDDTIKLFSYVVHYDEKTPHMHINFNNHTKQAKSVFQNLKISKKLTEFQDLVGEDFKHLGYKRGVKKSKTKHLSVARMHDKENLKLAEKKAKLKEEINEIRIEKRKLKYAYEKLVANNRREQFVRDEREKLKRELDRLDKQMREARETLKIEQNKLNDIKSDITHTKTEIIDLKSKYELLNNVSEDKEIEINELTKNITHIKTQIELDEQQHQLELKKRNIESTAVKTMLREEDLKKAKEDFARDIEQTSKDLEEKIKNAKITELEKEQLQKEVKEVKETRINNNRNRQR